MWPVSYAECTTCEVISTMSEEDRDVFERMAAEYLWNWTDHKYGLTEVTLRPCRTDCDGRAPTFFGGGPYPGLGAANVRGASFSPALIGGSWAGIGCGTCGSVCSCGDGPGTLVLPGPAASVVQITLDGSVLPGTAYKLLKDGRLMRLDGQSWPVCQDMSLPTTSAGTWAVTYRVGIEVPIGGQVAAGRLACELAKAAKNDNSCALPQRIKTVTRQGVTVAVVDSMDDIDKGHTGIWIIDSWIASVTKPRTGGSVRSVDVPVRKVGVWS